MDMWCDVDQVTKMTNKVKRMGFGQKELTLGWFGHERERERKKKEIQTSLFDIRSFTDRNSLGQERKFIYSMRVTHGYRKHRISLRIQARSSGNQRFRV